MKDVSYIIIFPDIHGREFWRPIMRKYLGKPEYGFIFLGDYFDPYPFENISETDALNNFRDMFNAFSNFDNVVWLIGNHDYHYLPWMFNEWGCRRSEQYLDIISQFFQDNFDKFNIAYEQQVGDKKYLFTHAGVSSGWAKQFNENVYNAQFLNNLKYRDKFKQIWQIGWDRGGIDENGSPIWADLYEMQWSEIPEDIYQIFGHTLSAPSFNSPLITNKFAMLDARKPFILDLATETISVLT